MESFSHFIFFLAFLIMGSFFSPAQSLACSSQTFPSRSFANCQDLPHLNAFLHWTYNPKSSSLSLAFLAPPPHSAGWVAWAVNPTATGMAGSQALLATLSAGAPTVRTSNLSSYSSVLPSPVLSFPVWDLSAEFSDGRFTIFATVKVPPNAKSLNQVWQVGPAVDPKSGAPAVHEFKPDNLNARSLLVFDGKSGASPAPAPATSSVDGKATSANAPSPDKGGVAGIRGGRKLGLVVGLFVFICGIISF